MSNLNVGMGPPNDWEAAESVAQSTPYDHELLADVTEVLAQARQLVNGLRQADERQKADLLDGKIEQVEAELNKSDGANVQEIRGMIDRLKRSFEGLMAAAPLLNES